MVHRLFDYRGVNDMNNLNYTARMKDGREQVVITQQVCTESPCI